MTAEQPKSRRPSRGTASRKLLAVLLLVVVLLSAGWWYYNNGRVRIALSKDQIVEHLSQKLPATKTYLYIFQVTYDAPRVELVEASKRINAGLDISVRVALLDDPEPLRGRIDAAAGVRYEPNEGAFYLQDPTIENLELDGLPTEWANKARDLVAQGINSYFSSHPIYRLTERQSHRAARAVLQEISIEKDHVILLLGTASPKPGSNL